MRLSSKLARVAPATTIALNERAMAMRRAGQDVVNFTVGEPDFPTPEHVRQAGIQAIETGHTKYTPAAGTEDLKEAICRKLLRDQGLQYERSQIVVSSGGKNSIYNLLFVTCEDGDEVLVPAPYWVSYTEMVKLVGAEPVVLPTTAETTFKITPDQLKAAITPRTKLLMLNSPCNPTGTVYSRAELEGLAAVIADAGIFVISDELYEKILYDGATHHSLAAFNARMYDLTLVVNGLSKAYAMTGWRLGYAAGPRPIMAGASKFQGQTVNHPSSITQYAGVAALNGPEDFIQQMVHEFHRRRDAIVERLNRMDGVSCVRPEGAFYVFPDVSAYTGRRTPAGQRITGSLDLSMYLLEERKVATVPGIAFGAEGFIRISYATSMEVIVRGLDRIEEGLAQLHE
ncbi:MAG: pyridoxal phosphate-dependent aminotransferase [Candidatus Latescibacteria bacterium]|nr:pyridoxal phosphate-dependent aminotransferase [Candidatus Latescibacterota bacterium]